jgi:inward rectifier potassium channel
MASINPSSHKNPNSGFGVQANQVGERFINKDGSFNIRKTGFPAWKTRSLYSYMQQIHWLKFLLIIVATYVAFNILFTVGYVLIGVGQLDGFEDRNFFHNIEECFYFSTQTFTTVGYGRINPHGTGANILASLETMVGWLFFALVTGLFYGRATRPRAYLTFSQKALIAPYRGGKGLMFRVVPYKDTHHLTNAKAVVNLSLLNTEKQEYEFYTLDLERTRIDAFTMNWTIVHPINEHSPFLNLTPDELEAADIEISVQITGFDPVFSNTVLARSSYTFKELVHNAKFLPMYHTSEDGKTTIVELDKLNSYTLLES